MNVVSTSVQYDPLQSKA